MKSRRLTVVMEEDLVGKARNREVIGPDLGRTEFAGYIHVGGHTNERGVA